MPQPRAQARAEIARRGLATAAVEHIARTSFGRMPITLVDRARAQLRRFFTDDDWTVEDDAALSALVGPGEGWTEEELAPDLAIAFGWRGGTFRVDVGYDPDPEAEPAPTARPRGDAANEAPRPRTLGDTFEDAVVLEPGRAPNELRFVTGPGTGGTGRYTRDETGDSPRVARLFREFPGVDSVTLGQGTVTVTITDPDRWNDVLLSLFDTVTAVFVPARPTPLDRQLERARAELEALDVDSPRDLAKLLDATTSPDPAFRRIAVARLERVDTIVTQRPWARALEDSSRAVKRAAVRAMSYAADPELRPLYEWALADKDPCTRYYALRGIAAIGVGTSEAAVDKRRRDDDIRVRLAAEAVVQDRMPA